MAIKLQTNKLESNETVNRLVCLVRANSTRLSPGLGRVIPSVAIK